MVRVKHQPVRRFPSSIAHPKKIQQHRLQQSDTLNKIITRMINIHPIISSSSVPYQVVNAGKALLHELLLETIACESGDNTVSLRLERPWVATLSLDDGNDQVRGVSNNICETFKQMGVRFDLISTESVNRVYEMALKLALCHLINNESMVIPMINLKN